MKAKSGTRLASRKTIEKPSWDFETQLGFSFSSIAGVDEVGRGCLAGPVLAAAVIPGDPADAHEWLAHVTDSKQMSPELRAEIAPQIQKWAYAWSIGEASVGEIDEINIFHASHLAMVRAVEGLPVRPTHLLVDGKFLPKSFKSGAATAIIKGDLKSYSIACASIIAKVFRDGMMERLDRDYPGYGLASHKGYATPMHQRALQALGATPIHRRSFAPVARAQARSQLAAQRGRERWDLPPT